MAERDSHIRGHGDSELWTCRCSNLILSRDPYQVCLSCLGLEHAQQVVEQPGPCPYCAAFTSKSRCRRLVSLSRADPYLPSATPGIEEEKEWGDAAAAALAAPTSSTCLVPPHPGPVPRRRWWRLCRPPHFRGWGRKTHTPQPPW